MEESKMKKVLFIGTVAVVMAGITAIADVIYHKGIEAGINLAQEDFDFSEEDDDDEGEYED
jgi:hypothetical protein